MDSNSHRATFDVSSLPSDRLGNLDVFRAVAALAVCLHHFNRESLTGGTWFSEITKYGNYGVDIFFVISGYVIPFALLRRNFQLSQIGIFLQGRFLRLYPAYALAAILTLGLWYASTWMPGFRGEGPPKISVAQILANATLTCDFFQLLHVPIGGRVMNFLERFSEFGFVQLLSVPLALAVSLFVAWIFFLLVEKPSHDLSQKITSSVRALKP